MALEEEIRSVGRAVRNPGSGEQVIAAKVPSVVRHRRPGQLLVLVRIDQEQIDCFARVLLVAS